MIWKKIKGFNDYSISDGGEVRRDDKGNILKQWVGTNGYLYVALCENGRSHSIRVHRLVAEAFCQKTNDGTDVNHIDGDKANNKASNLEWVTKSQNMIHAYNNSLQKRTSTGIVRRVICLEDMQVYPSCGEAGRYYNISSKTIYACCARNSKGRIHTFRFAD